MMSTPGAPREDYFAELAQVRGSGRELSPQEWTALYARHDQVMVEEAQTVGVPGRTGRTD